MFEIIVIMIFRYYLLVLILEKAGAVSEVPYAMPWSQRIFDNCVAIVYDNICNLPTFNIDYSADYFVK